MRGLYISVLRKVLDETVVGNFSGVWESVHVLANFHIDVVLVDFVFELILLYDGCWNIPAGLGCACISTPPSGCSSKSL
jgi:hypothetical protein